MVFYWKERKANFGANHNPKEVNPYMIKRIGLKNTKRNMWITNNLQTIRLDSSKQVSKKTGHRNM
ncbi:unnamed protein product [Prunus armeniaca]